MIQFDYHFWDGLTPPTRYLFMSLEQRGVPKMMAFQTRKLKGCSQLVSVALLASWLLREVWRTGLNINEWFGNSFTCIPDEISVYCWPFSPNNQHGGYPCMSWSIIFSCAKVYRLLSISKLSLGNRMNMGHPWKGKAVPELMFQHILYWLYFNCPVLFLPVIFRSVVAPTYLNQKETIDPYWLENYIALRLVPATQTTVVWCWLCSLAARETIVWDWDIAQEAW